MQLGWKPLAAGGGAIVILVGIIAAASSSSGASPGSPAADGAAAVIAAWKADGLAVSAFAPRAEATLGGDCQAGKVGGVDVTLCRYPDPGKASAAVDAGFDAVGATTGTALAQGPMLLVVADRHHADPEGRTIDKLARAFEGK
jgi:hypothetical protein